MFSEPYTVAATLHIVQAAAALGPAGVWAFGVIDPRLNLVIPYSARYHGRAG